MGSDQHFPGIPPGARDKIVFDPYPIIRYMNKAVDDVRKCEHREYRARGGETLPRSRYLCLYAQEKLPQKHLDRFEQLRAMNLKTGHRITNARMNHVLQLRCQRTHFRSPFRHQLMLNHLPPLH